MIMERQHYKPSKSANPEESASDGKEGGPSNDVNTVRATSDAFRVDTGLIPQGALDEQGSSELQELGLTVFNQDVFEQGIIDQVDHALAKEEEIRLKNVLMRELTAINDDILLAKKDLDRANEAEAKIENISDRNRDLQRQLESIRKQKENKIKQLRTLSVRRENVGKKLAWFDRSTPETAEDEEAEHTVDEAFNVGAKPKKETERERMIRTGEMTPFGTLVKVNTQQSSSKQIHLSDFEKLFVAKESTQKKVQKDFSKYLKQRTARASNAKKAKLDDSHEESSSKSSVKLRKTEKFDEKDKHSSGQEAGHSLPKRKRNAGSQSQPEQNEMTDGEDFERDAEEIEDEEDEYHPSKDELQDEFSDDEEYADEDNNTHGKKKSTRRRGSLKRKKPRPLPKYRGNSDEDEPLRTKVKRDKSIRQEKDDADAESYQKRLFRQQKLDQLEEGQDADSDNDPEAEFDGGFQVPRKLWKKLFNYQKTGVRWLWELHCQQAGGIVGDEMGLGKTIQTISFLAALRTSNVRNVNFPYKGLGPTIIICPTTVMHQWLKEFHKWWPDFRVAILHSSGSFTGSESDLVRSIAKSQGILITSYNTLVIHQELVLRFNWHYVILDEGHKIRNPDAKVTLCAKQFRTPHRIILSGSPIQNNLKELWSLFDFVFPGKLGTLPDFMQHFSIPIVQGGYSNATQTQVETAYRCACVLRDTINPYLIRRMKSDVKKHLDLPNKNEQVLFCRLTNEQRDVYQEYLDSRECNDILQGKFQVFAGLITLRKICNHPDLSTGGPQVFQGQDMPDEPECQFGYYKRSGKMIVVEALLRLWHKQKHRVLLFTQSKAMLNILEKLAQNKGYTYLVMDGGTPISARQPLISQYNNDPSIYLFLLTTRVGGLGVNLTGADRVIIYDPDWNPSTDVQARERAWRIGQTRQVTIYRLLTSGTIEEKIYHRQIFKQFLTNRVLKDPKQRRLFKSHDMWELFSLGSQDNEEGTETSALFAGTGSDVRIPRKLRKNRFDELQEKIRKEKEEKETKEEADGAKHQKRTRGGQLIMEEEEAGVDFDSEELERMKEFARQLSRKIEAEKKQRELKGNEHIEESKTVDRQTVLNSNDKKIEDGIHQDIDKIVMESNKTSAFESGNVNEDTNITAQKELQQGQKDSINTAKAHNWKQNGKKWTIPTLKKDRAPIHGDELEKNKIINGKGKKLSAPLSSHERSIIAKKSLAGKNREPELSKHTKKRKHHDAKFEGERISHLVKNRPLPTNAVPEDDQQQNRQTGSEGSHQDDYVLRQLFKKTGIHGAMKHDKIMDSGRPDYVIVEAEAERVAREAAAALRRSRQQCASALAGVPTWTGQHGGLVKPRFGQKKNSLLVEKSGKSEAASSSQSSLNVKAAQKETGEKLFDGSISGNVSLNPKNNSLTSSDLLNKIRARKRLSALATDPEEDDEFLRPDRPQTVEPKDEELLQDIRNYIAFMATNDGEATTQEIVLNFGKRLPKSDAPKFKAMLNQVCEFHNGVWRLKSEFR
ncbi:unnamed protein product [Candidula unifasciata]|uniref:DNA excision repair protein ERCC-6 n=1 Tax=Candidula unifasciata TaxID=100452 RepID=A0A8S3ZMF7_9EUPU|nr:unnamed protein product [Candidula unifasciata]